MVASRETRKLIDDDELENATSTTTATNASPEQPTAPRYEYTPAPLGIRIAQSAGTILLGTACSAFFIFYMSRQVKRLHVLVPKKAPRGQAPVDGTLLMVENVLHPRAVGRIFDVNHCDFVVGKSELSLFSYTPILTFL